jgi:hypothetical protein
MKVNYEEFLSRFEASGLTQQEFGKQEGLSSSMVSYYVTRGRQSREGGFAKVKVIKEHQTPRLIKVTYPGGIQVELPI